MGKYLFLLIVFLLAVQSQAATNIAASVSRSDVNTAMAACSDGDTLSIPAGASVWTSALTVTKSISIIGAGTNSTFITNGQASGVCTIFAFEPSANAPQRLSSMAFIQTNGFAQQYIITVKGAISAFRLDRCFFTQGKTIIQTALSAGSGPVFGVIDHNHFYNCSLEIQCFNFRTGDTLDGDQMWTAWRASPSSYIGTTNSMVVENNSFHVDNSLAGDNDEPMSGGRGAIYAWRFNTHRSANTSRAYVGSDMHGAFAGVRGGILYEIYSNAFYVSTTYRLTKQRGGSWMAFGNTYWNTNTVRDFVNLGAETGTEQTANAATGDGYTNSFYWANISNGSENTTVVNDSLLPAVEGTHYFLHAPNATNNFYPYTPLVYPHPLVTAQDGGGGDVTAPTCAITSPTNNQPSVATSIAINGTSSDNVAVSSVTLTNVSTATGFTVNGTTSWSATATLAYGSNYIRAIATDSSGNKATNAIAVLAVNNTNTWSSERSPYLGVQYLQVQNPAAQHTLMSNVPATYVNMPITYAILTGGAYGGSPNGTNYYDLTYALNTNNGWRVILQFSDMPTNKILTYLPYLTNRYPCWMVIPLNENPDTTETSETIKYYRAVMPNMRLGGPALYHLQNPTYVNTLITNGAFQMLDSFVMHDYLAVPLNGLCTSGWWTNEYYHPIYTPTNYNPGWSVSNLVNRLTWMNSYTNVLRTNFTDTPKVMVTEYGIYQNDAPDGAYAGQVFRNMQIPVWVTANFATTNQCPYNNALYDGVGVGYFTLGQQNFISRVAPAKRATTLNVTTLNIQP